MMTEGATVTPHTRNWCCNCCGRCPRPFSRAIESAEYGLVVADIDIVCSRADEFGLTLSHSSRSGARLEILLAGVAECTVGFEGSALDIEYGVRVASGNGGAVRNTS